MFFCLGDGTVSVKTILSKANKGPNLRSCFESGVAGLDIDYLHRLLAEHTDGLKSTGTGICYDFDFYTPSVRKRRFTLWLQDTKKELGTVTQVDCDQTGSEEFHCSGSAVLKIKPAGFLSTPSTRRFKADIAMPGYPYDCRLLMTTGQLHTCLFFSLRAALDGVFSYCSNS